MQSAVNGLGGNYGIWKTTNGGATWAAINDGLTAPQFRGRVGLDIARSNPNVVYAIIDSYDTGRPANPGERDAYRRLLPAGSNIIKGLEVYRSDNKGQSWKLVSGQTPQTSVAMMGLGNTYSWVFTQIRVDTRDENTVYILALGVSVSHDGGAERVRVREIRHRAREAADGGTIGVDRDARVVALLAEPIRERAA